MPRELTSCYFGGNIKWLSLEALSKGGSRPLALSFRKGEDNESYRTYGIFCRRIVLGYYRATLYSMVGSTYLSTSGLWTARGSGICAGEYLTPLDYLRYETSS